MKCFLSLLLVLSLTKTARAQLITGTIKDTNDSLVTNAYVVFKSDIKSEQIDEFVSVRNGIIKYKLKKKYQTLFAEVKATGYRTVLSQLEITDKDSTYQLSIKLEKAIIELQEVKVVSKRFPFQIQGDTVSFNVNSYKDGNERKIQEIIKKLPGVEVNEKSGEIKYKGKSVETVLLEGDNLFDHNYSVGTKNINVNMVDQIQAIDNYSANPLLRGIEKDGKVALNLKLKKGKFGFSGSADGGIGQFSSDRGLARYINSTLLGITSNYKSFGSFSTNNVGLNDSPSDYFTNTKSVEQLKSRDILANKLIDEHSFNTSLDAERVNLNNQVFGNYNQLVRLTNKLTFKTNFYFQKDVIQSLQLLDVKNLIGDTVIRNLDTTRIIKKPTLYRGDAYIKFNLTKKSLLEYDMRYSYEHISTPTEIRTNIIPYTLSDLDTKSYYISQKLLYTGKINESSALQFRVSYNSNSTPQLYSIDSVNILGKFLSTINQQSWFKKNNILADLTLIGKNRNHKYAYTIGYDVSYNRFLSELMAKEGTPARLASLSRNDLSYSQALAYLSASHQVELGKFYLNSSVNISQLTQRLETGSDPNKIGSNLLIQPTLSGTFRTTKYSTINASVSFSRKPNSVINLFSQPVLINNRSLVSNLPDLTPQKELAYRLNFTNYNLEKAYQFSSSVGYNSHEGGYFSDYTITNSNINIKNYFLTINNTSINFDASVSKFISSISSTVKFSSQTSQNSYQNIVNGSQIRDNSVLNLNGELFVKSAFSSPINIENTFTFAHSRSSSSEQTGFTNTSANNSFKLMAKLSKEWFFSGYSQYYLPRFTFNTNTIHFVDLRMDYTPVSKKYALNIVVNNLTNEALFDQTTTTDFSIIRYQVSLLPRQIRLSINWNF